MRQPLLTIAIPTIVDRRTEFRKLRNELNKQRMSDGLMKDVVIDFIEDNREITVGEKRNELYKRASGLYCVQWDDDDSICDCGLAMIVEALREAPDCVTYEERVDIDGKIQRSNHSLHYDDWHGDGQSLLWDGFHFHRTPFFKNPIRTDIARKVTVPSCRFGEDHLFAKEIRPLLKTEVHIDKEIYLYQHVSSNPVERYGLNK